MTAGTAQRATVIAALGVVLASCALGCTGRLAELTGGRRVTEWVTPEPVGADAVAEVPVTFVLRNSSLGTVRVENAAVPVSTSVSTEPPLPAAVPPGRSLTVSVVARFRAVDGDAIRHVRLEAAGQPPLELVVEARIKPVPPSDASVPAAVGGAPGPAPVSPPAASASPQGPG